MPYNVIYPTGNWDKLGAGGFNTAYLSPDKSWVLKFPHDKNCKTDTPERSIALWNEINADAALPARYPDPTQGEGNQGWISPFIKGRPATDLERAQFIKDTFHCTGRIIMDAFSIDNFIFNEATGKVVCVDVGLALNLWRAKNPALSQRRSSVASLEAWDALREEYSGDQGYYNCYKTWYPNTIRILKALIFIKENAPNILDVRFLDHPETVATLAKAFDCQTKTKGCFTSSMNYFFTLRALRILNVKGSPLHEEERELSLDVIKERCEGELKRYINSRGSMKNGTFSLSFSTQFFRNPDLTHFKITAAERLKGRIKDAQSLEEIDNILKAVPSDKLFSATITSGFQRTIGQCSAIIKKAKECCRNESMPHSVKEQIGSLQSAYYPEP